MTNPYAISGPALVSFSGGRTSAYMLRQIIEAHGGALPPDVHVVFANTGKEMPETLDFVQACSERWQVPIVWVEFDPDADHETRIVTYATAARNGEPYAALIRKRRFLPNPVARFCTAEMKVRRMAKFMHKLHGYAHWTNVVGLRADEPRRVMKTLNPEAQKRQRWRNACPLSDAHVTKEDVFAFWQEQPFDLALPVIGGKTPLGNCDLCFLKGKGTLLSILQDRPDLAGWWIDTEANADTSKGSGARFRNDRAPYAALLAEARQSVPAPDDGEVDCACTD